MSLQKLTNIKIALIMVKGDVYRFDNRSFLFKHMPDSLTLGTLAGIIKNSFPDISIQIYDETVGNIDKTKIDADLIGISAITPAIYRAYEFADYFREKGRCVFIGGVHATLCPQEVKEHSDSVICGLAEESLVSLIRDFQKGSIKDFYKQSESMSFRGFPFPDRKIYERQNIFATELNMVHATYGCTNMCCFCVQPQLCSGYHQRPIDDVIQEIKQIDDDYIEFIDPNLSKDENYLTNLCLALIPLKKQWFAPMTVSICNNEELLGLLKKSGCSGVLIGFESVSQDSVKSLNKGFNRVDEYKNVVKKLHEYNIKVTGSFVLGLDSDDVSSFFKTQEFVISANIDYVRYTINTPYPGTKYFEKLKSENRIITMDWSRYDCMHCVFVPKKLSPAELEYGYEQLWKYTYKFKNIVKRLSYLKNPLLFFKEVFINWVFGKVYIKMMFKKNR